MPWVRIGTGAIGITTVALFAIPQSMGDTGKVVWFLLAYILFDLFYTVLDAPAFAVTTVMTPDVEERTSVIATGKLWSMVGGVIATVLVPMFRPMLGWFTSCVVFVAVSVVLMIPMLFSVKERRNAEATNTTQEVNQPSMGRNMGTRTVAITPPTMLQSLPVAMTEVRSSTSEVITVVKA